MDDREIVALYLARSERAIEETRCKYGSYCRTIARNILRSEEDSEECVSDTWLRLWNSIPPAEPQRLGAYLGRICRNAALNMLKRQAAKKRSGGEFSLAAEELAGSLGAMEDEILERMQLTELMNRFLASLKPAARRIFMLRYWYFSSVSEIAAELSMGESRVKMSLSRSRQALRQMLEREGIEI